MTTNRIKDPSGIYGDLVSIDLTTPEPDKDMAAAFALLTANAPGARIRRLIAIPAVAERAHELERWYVDLKRSANGPLLLAIADLERVTERLTAVPLILDGHKKRQDVEEAKKNGKIGGKANKRSKWADDVAKRLARIAEGRQDEAAWRMLPKSENPWGIGTKDADFEVYVDDDTLIGVDENTGKEARLTKATFLKNYYRPAKNGK